MPEATRKLIGKISGKEITRSSREKRASVLDRGMFRDSGKEQQMSLFPRGTFHYRSRSELEKKHGKPKIEQEWKHSTDFPTPTFDKMVDLLSDVKDLTKRSVRLSERMGKSIEGLWKNSKQTRATTKDLMRKARAPKHAEKGRDLLGASDAERDYLRMRRRVLMSQAVLGSTTDFLGLGPAFDFMGRVMGVDPIRELGEIIGRRGRGKRERSQGRRGGILGMLSRFIPRRGGRRTEASRTFGTKTLSGFNPINILDPLQSPAAQTATGQTSSIWQKIATGAGIAGGMMRFGGRILAAPFKMAGKVLSKVPLVGRLFGGGAAAAVGAKGGVGALGKLGKFGRGALGVGKKVLWPLAAVMSLFDAKKGWGAAGQDFGVDQGKATFGQKLSSSVGGILEGLTFGLLNRGSAARALHGAGSFVGKIGKGVWNWGKGVVGKAGEAYKKSGTRGAIGSVASSLTGGLLSEETATKAVGAAIDSVKKVVGFVKDSYKTITGWISQTYDDVKHTFTGMWDGIKSVGQWVVDKFAAGKRMLIGVWDTVKSGIGFAVDGIKNASTWVVEKVKAIKDGFVWVFDKLGSGVDYVIEKLTEFGEDVVWAFENPWDFVTGERRPKPATMVQDFPPRIPSPTPAKKIESDLQEPQPMAPELMKDGGEGKKPLMIPIPAPVPSNPQPPAVVIPDLSMDIGDPGLFLVGVAQFS